MHNFLLRISVTTIIFFSISLLAFGQTDSVNSISERELSVAVHSQPPYLISGDQQNWDGISIQLWREIAEKLQLKYKLVSVPADSQLSALQKGEVDLVLLSNATAEKDSLLDFSYPYHSTTLGVAMPGSNKLTSIAKAFFSKRFWQIVLILSVLLLIVGTVIYFIERTSNEESFGGERTILKGIGAGFWWAGVTMTTIGYGDKAPVTFFGRAVALLWMLMALAVTSVLTASLVSVMGGSYTKTLTVPEDLRNMKVAVAEGSSTAQYMREKNVDFQAYAKLEEALKAVQNKEKEVVVSDVAQLKYLIENNNNIALQIQSKPLNSQYYAIGMKDKNPLREEIDRALLQIITTDQWEALIKRYVPEKANN